MRVLEREGDNKARETEREERGERREELKLIKKKKKE